MGVWLRTLAVAALLVALPPAAAEAAPGDLDPSFGGGRVIVPFGSEAAAGGVAVQADGKVVIAGSAEGTQGFAVARLLPNGSPDPSFGGTGVVVTPLGKFATSTDVAVQADGRIVAVGKANEDFAIVRYLENGELDPSFGEGGIVLMPVGTLEDRANAVAIGPGGLIAVTGISDIPPNEHGVGVAVLRSNGDPEKAFAEDGTTVVSTKEGNDRGEGIAVQVNGRIVIADASGPGGGDGFTVVRLDTDGKPDTSFSGDGVVQTPIPGEGGVAEGRSTDIAIQPDGKIVAGGYGFDEAGLPPDDVGKFALARYRTNGELDPSFGTGGIASARVGTGEAAGWAVAVAPDGRLILGGDYDTNPSPLENDLAPALLRFNPDGSLDPTFGADGLVMRPLPAGIEEEFLEGVALQADGRILTTGEASLFTGPSSAVASRYLADFEKPTPAPARFGRPDSDMKPVPRHLSHGELKGVRGTASDPGGEGVREVQVALIRLGAVCAPMSRAGLFGRGARTSRAKCAKRWLTTRGTTKWAFKLPRPLPLGHYVVFSRAIDVQGISEEGFSRHDRNRYAFRVVGAHRP